MIDIDKLRREMTHSIENAVNADTLNDVRVSLFGKKGELTALMKTLGQMSDEERRTVGQSLNALKNELMELTKSREEAFEKEELDKQLAQEKTDVTLPARHSGKGKIHPISHTMAELTAIFGAMGFSIAEGPDIEDDWHNFTALNFPPGHPAREMHDTFYLPDGKDANGNDVQRLLRTHTSTVQIRAMQEQGVPIRVLVMGRTYRSDYDLTHTPMFHQCEGLYIGENIHMGHLKGCLMDFVRTYFEVDSLPVRFRPSYFPFTEPSAEMDIGCTRSKEQLKIGEGDDWLEILGCGMVHPNVLQNCGIDPDKYQGFAFGMGIERIAMLKYGIPDLRTFFESDVRWLDHYGFDPLNLPNRAFQS